MMFSPCFVPVRHWAMLALGCWISLTANGFADDKMPEKITTVEGITEFA